MTQSLTIPTDWLQPNGLVLPGDLAEADWEHIGWAFLYLDEVSQWAIGDWYNEGVKRHGFKSVVALLENLKKQYPYLHLSKKKLKTIQNYASLCKAFPIHSRKWECLSFWHYYKVQGYEPEERDAYLAHANTMEMTAAHFEKYLQEQDKSRKSEIRQQRAEELAHQNDNLKEHVKVLEVTVEMYRDQVEELNARNDHLAQAIRANEARLAAARASDADGWSPERLVCPECGYLIERNET